MADKYNEYSPPPQGPPPPYNQQPAPAGFSQQVMYPHPASTSSTTVVTSQPMVAAQPVIIVAGANCPACRTGILRNDFTTCGIVMGICFFPIGLLCCFLMMERRCSYCGLTFA
ncbi:brain protein I3-like isoform X2 [Eriocheir sinensis]|uniref:brain protein I3-like isoform X2 n=1 Tax=Eriocheir sinensis TaxID=95602 RepID=UPI0021C688AF|nr:brain protein I3-like isoform X2 [Eriocheir sinensis]